MDEEHAGDIKVTDKRRFTEKGEVREGVQEPNTANDIPRDERGTGEASTQHAEAPPSIDFPTFLLSLASSAQVHLGLIPNPQTGKVDKNAALAKQTIDILGVLREKTAGNLSKDEERLFEGILYELRMKYVELNKEAI